MRRLGLLQVLIFLVLVGIAFDLAVWTLLRNQDVEALILNLATEFAGAAVTYILIEVILGRTKQLEEEERELEDEKARWIEEMGSQVHDVAVPATERLRQHGWLTDGSLQRAKADLYRADLRGARLSQANLREVRFLGANLSGAELFAAGLQAANLSNANLSSANLSQADLSRANLVAAHLGQADLSSANLSQADLRGADLREASLSGADLQAASLRAANLGNANLSGADLWEARFDEGAVLPDGTNWTPEADLARFTDPTHPDFWKPEGVLWT